MGAPFRWIYEGFRGLGFRVRDSGTKQAPKHKLLGGISTDPIISGCIGRRGLGLTAVDVSSI